MGNSFRLKECRTARGYTQQEVADAIGVSRVCYTRYETGAREIPLDVLVRLARFYDCTTDELLGTWFYYEVVRYRK